MARLLNAQAARRESHDGLDNLREYEDRPLEECINEIMNESPDMIDCGKIFWHLFGFKNRELANFGIYGKYGALGFEKKALSISL